MANFEEAIEYVFANEGGRVNNPADGGGPTAFGISSTLLNSIRTGSESIPELSQEDAKRIYFQHFWEPLHLGELASQSIATAIMDQAVNRGPFHVIQLVQKIVGVKADGVIGPMTIAALNLTVEKEFMQEFLKQTKLAYNGIVEKHEDQRVFLDGWLDRAERMKDLG